MNSLRPAHDFRIITLTSTTTAQTLRKLINDRLATITKSLPTTGSIIRIGITCSANTEMRDGQFEEALTLSSSTRYVFDILDPLDKITLKNSATVTLEIYWGL